MAISSAIGNFSYIRRLMVGKNVLRFSHEPFTLHLTAEMTAAGVLDPSIPFDDAMHSMCEDIDLSLQMLAKHRIVLTDNRWWWKSGQWTVGGCAMNRDISTRNAANRRLQRRWGSGAIQIDDDKHGSRVTVKRA